MKRHLASINGNRLILLPQHVTDNISRHSVKRTINKILISPLGKMDSVEVIEIDTETIVPDDGGNWIDQPDVA